MAEAEKPKAGKPVRRKADGAMPKARKGARATPHWTKPELRKALKPAQAMAKDYAADPDKALRLSEAALDKLRRNSSALQKVWDDLATLIRLVKAWATRKYREIPWQTVIIAIAAIIYFVNPFDLIPDFIPAVGFIDDAAVIGFVVWSVRADLERFRHWEESQK